MHEPTLLPFFPPDAPPEEPPEAPKRLVWESTHDLRVPAAGETSILVGANCVAVFSDGPQLISNVTAKAEWSHPAPTSLYLIYEEGPNRRHNHTLGASPLTIEMPQPATLEPKLALFYMSLEPAPGSMAPLTLVQLSLSFEHDAEVEVWPGACDFM